METKNPNLNTSWMDYRSQMDRIHKGVSHVVGSIHVMQFGSRGRTATVHSPLTPICACDFTLWEGKWKMEQVTANHWNTNNRIEEMVQQLKQEVCKPKWPKLDLHHPHKARCSVLICNPSTSRVRWEVDKALTHNKRGGWCTPVGGRGRQSFVRSRPAWST